MLFSINRAISLAFNNRKSKSIWGPLWLSKQKAHREYYDLGMTFAQAYENLTSKGFLKSLDSTPMPNSVPPT